jgi:hypothetical protein
MDAQPSTPDLYVYWQRFDPVPPGVLAAGRRYVFQVMLEDLEDGTLENRSIAFSEPYVVARQEAPGELNSALSRSPRNFDRVDFRVVD